MRVLALAFALLVLGVPAGAGRNAASCPRDARLGAVTFVRGGHWLRVSLADCRERRVKAPRPASTLPLRSRAGRVARVAGRAKIVVDGRVVHRGRARDPLGLLTWSPDGRWLFFYADPYASNSIAADGLAVRALRVSDGSVVNVAHMLITPDYFSWCGSALVLTAGIDRVATHNKRLLVARAPTWRPQPLWPERSRAFGSVTCAPGGASVAVLSQPESTDARFFHARWQLWRIGLDGARRLLDAPPRGFADESPRWSRDDRALLFVRERQGVGRLMLWHDGSVVGPFANLGYSLGYYGHHDWWALATWSDSQ